jgi:F-type H+-transporting ATPase subunit b
MELDWSTFLLEIINFLILVWILKRFLYQPVLEIIARRREGVEKTLREAQNLHIEAEAMKEHYQHRLSDWEQEKVRAWESLQQALNEERARQSEQLQILLAQQREKNRMLEEQHLQELAQHKEIAALTLAGRFARRLLERLACPALEARIIEVTLEELAKLPPARLEALRSNASHINDLILISTAYPLDESQRFALQQEVDRLLARAVHYEFHQEPSLLAGLRIDLGPWAVQANLREELQLFREVAYVNPPSAN